MEKLIKIIKNAGEESLKFITAFKISDNNFIVLDSNLKDSDGNVKTYISKIDNEFLDYIEDSDWELVKSVLVSIVKEDENNYEYISINDSYQTKDDEKYTRVLGLKEESILKMASKYEIDDDAIDIPIIGGMSFEEESDDLYQNVEQLDIDDEIGDSQELIVDSSQSQPTSNTQEEPENLIVDQPQE